MAKPGTFFVLLNNSLPKGEPMAATSASGTQIPDPAEATSYAPSFVHLHRLRGHHADCTVGAIHQCSQNLQGPPRYIPGGRAQRREGGLRSDGWITSQAGYPTVQVKEEERQHLTPSANQGCPHRPKFPHSTGHRRSMKTQPERLILMMVPGPKGSLLSVSFTSSVYLVS